MYLEGDGGEPDYTKGFSFTQQAATAGNAIGLNNMGHIYEQGWASPLTASWRSTTTSRRPRSATTTAVENRTRLEAELNAPTVTPGVEPYGPSKIANYRPQPCSFSRRLASTATDAATRCALEKNSRWMRKPTVMTLAREGQPFAGEPGHHRHGEIIGPDAVVEVLGRQRVELGDGVDLFARKCARYGRWRRAGCRNG